MILDIDKRRVNFCGRRLVVVVGEIAYLARVNRERERARETGGEGCGERKGEGSVLFIIPGYKFRRSYASYTARLAQRVLKRRSTCNDVDPARYVNTRGNYQPGGSRRAGGGLASKNFNIATRIIPSWFTQRIFAGKLISLLRIRDLFRDDDFESWWSIPILHSLSLFFFPSNSILLLRCRDRCCIRARGSISVCDRWNVRLHHFVYSRLPLGLQNTICKYHELEWNLLWTVTINNLCIPVLI